MPDTMITTADVAEVRAKPKTLKVLLREYREAYTEWNVALKGDYDQNMTEAESLAYQERVAAPTDAAREALIQAPVVSFEDIALKLRFLFEIDDEDSDGEPDSGSWEARIVKNILRDIEKPKAASLRELRKQCVAAFRASMQADADADEELYRAQEAAGDAADAEPSVRRLRDAAKAANDRWLRLDNQFITTPAQTLQDIGVKLEFLTVMADMHTGPDAEVADQMTFSVLGDIERITGVKF